jgi:RNA polymerase sigma-70 factor (ECF subfamily)
MGSDGSEKGLTSVIVMAERRVRDPADTADAADDDIVGAIRRGERETALAGCARRHGPALGRLCMAMLGSQAEADDAVQETLLAAHTAFDGFRGEGSLRAWLFGIARRRCARALEQRGPLGAAAEQTDPRMADELLDVRRRAETARALLARVRPSEREALLLRYTAELSFREVGEALGIDEATARKRVSRALGRLRELASGATHEK